MRILGLRILYKIFKIFRLPLNNIFGTKTSLHPYPGVTLFLRDGWFDPTFELINLDNHKFLFNFSVFSYYTFDDKDAVRVFNERETARKESHESLKDYILENSSPEKARKLFMILDKEYGGDRWKIL